METLLVITGLTHYVAMVAAVAFVGVLVVSTAKELYQRSRHEGNLPLQEMVNDGAL
jgi:ABC-type enterochelin transport system permease subunit